MSDLGELIYSHCLLRLNILSENNDFGFYSFQKKKKKKKKKSKFFPFKLLRKQI